MPKTIKRRRKENKTNYSKRIKFLKGNTPRVIFRKTNKYILGQLVISKEAQDKVEFGVTSKQLLNHGWPKDAEGSLKSITAAYFTGYMLGKKLIKEKKEKVIIDFGILRSVHKTKKYAFMKGMIDSGIKLNYKKEIFPEEERIKGDKLKKKIPFEEIKSKIDKL